MTSVQEHPELLLGANPLLESLAPYIPMSELPAKLRREPLKNVPWHTISVERRIALLPAIDLHYWPTRSCLEIADSIQTMLRAGYMARNPLSRREQKRINMLALGQTPSQVALQSLRTRAGGGILSGMTGTGKSTLVERTLEVIAPDQIVRHGRSESCGWLTLTQVSYLIAEAPSNGSRGGLISRILAALDTLLGTDYCDTFRRLRNLDVALLFVVKVLSNHRVGLIVLDENQRDNFDECAWQREIVLFFLALMNLGIPILLVGNPFAFGGLESVSQVMRRFSSSGYHRLVPASSASEDWWCKDCVPGICRFRLVENMPPVEAIVEGTFPKVGGISGLFAALSVEAQRNALRRGGDQATLEMNDFDVAAQSPSFMELADIASQVTGRMRARFTDIPSRSDGKGESTATAEETGANCSPDVMKYLRSLTSQLNRAQKKREDREAKNKKLLETLSPEDLRGGEAAMEILAGLREEQLRLAAIRSKEPA